VNDADDVLNLERLDVLNPERLEEAFGDDRAAIANLLGLACNTELRYIGALREGIARADIRAVARAAHSIKGSASNIGAARVSRIAADIEDRARRECWEGIAGRADELDCRYTEMTARIAEYAAKIV
jgi:HPt (histidine-containing phosphotransfer) domain-containing protein